MTQTFTSPQIVCRPSLPRDLEEIKEFCKMIWDGQDYVPKVIEEWFYDSWGPFAVAEYKGHAIGCAKVTWLTEGQWWLEGFRVDPKYQGLKVGSHLHNYVNEWWLEHGNGVVRLMTSSKNERVHHLCKSTGFTKLFEVRGYKAEPLHGCVDIFTSAASNDKDLGKVIEFALASPSLAITDRVMDFGWRFADPTYKRALTFLFLTLSSFEGNFFWWRDEKGLLITWDDFDDYEVTMGIGVLACELEDMSALLMDARHLAAKWRKTSVFWLAPVNENVELALKQAGYTSDWNNTAYVFEKKHPQRSDQYEPPF